MYETNAKEIQDIWEGVPELGEQKNDLIWDSIYSGVKTWVNSLADDIEVNKLDDNTKSHPHPRASFS
jgi:hypothetical protein